VAVRADEHALEELLPIGVEGLAGRGADGEGLLGGIDVVEMHVDDAALVSTQDACAAGLFD
jgi:hypothetical protein